MGGWVDETFHAETIHGALGDLASRIGLDAFDEFFGRRLGLYRAMVESRQKQPSVAEERTLVGEAMEFVQQVRSRLEFLPPDATAEIDAACWKRRHELFHEFRLRLDADLKEAWSLLALTERQLDQYKGAAGRKHASQRDWFLHDVARKLGEYGLGKIAAADTAAKVLRAAGIDAPENSAEARKLILAMEKTIGGK